MDHPIFPFTIKAYSTDYYTASPYRYRAHFLKAFQESTPKGSTYFAFDVILKSATEVEFVAYHMFDNVRGGIGDEFWRGSATVPAKLTEEDIQEQIKAVAKMRRKEERALAEEAAIARHLADIVAEMEALA